MKSLSRYTRVGKQQLTIPNHIAFIMTMLMIAPAILGILLYIPSTSGEIGSEDVLYWPQFQRTPTKDAVWEEDIRGIDDPVLKWDLEMDVLSMGTTAADFTANIDDDSGYDRDVVHLVFCAANDDGNFTIFIVDGDTGETAWSVDLANEEVQAGPVVGYLDNDDELDIVFATISGIVYAYEPDMDYNPENGEGDRYEWDTIGNSINDQLWAFDTENEIRWVTPILIDLEPDDPDHTMDVVITTRFSDSQSKVFALEGWTTQGDGDKLWERTLDGEIISTPSAYLDGTEVRVWVSAYHDTGDDYNEQYMYQLKGSNQGIIDIEIEEYALMGTWDDILPGPVIADLLGDEDMEIIMTIPMDPDNEDNGIIFVYNDNGDPIDEWRHGKSIKGRLDSSPVVADLDNDGKKSIIMQGWYFSGYWDASTIVSVYDRDGSRVWNKELNTDSDSLEDRTFSSPVLFDVDRDGNLDVIAATNPRIFAFDGRNGDRLDGFSTGFRLDDDLHNLQDSPAIGDFDHDGIFDIVIDSTLITQSIAELEVGRIYLSDYEPEAGDLIDIDTDVYNNGTADAGNVLIRFMDGNTTIHEDLHTIRAGSPPSPKPQVDDYEVSGGWHTFRVIVDPDDEIDEVNKTNNILELEIYVPPPYEYSVYAPILEKMAYPQSQVNFDVRINNTGTRDDSYMFNGSELSAGWGITITGPSGTITPNEDTLDVASGEREDITITFDVPDEKAHVRETLTLEIMSQNEDLMAVVNLTVQVRQVYGVDLRVTGGTTKERISPDGSIEFPLLVENLGNGDDDYTLDTDDHEIDPWSAWVSPSKLDDIGSGRTKTSALNVIAPSAEELTEDNLILYLNITVQSDSDGSTNDKVMIQVEIVQLVVPDDFLEVYPNETARFALYIFNAADKTTSVNLEVDRNTNSWVTEFDDSHFEIASKDTVIKYLNVTVPKNADPHTTTTIDIKANFKTGENEKNEYATVITRARQLYDVDITTFTNPDFHGVVHDHLDPSEVGNYLLNFTNTGSWYDNFTLECTNLPEDWNITFTPSLVENVVKGDDVTIQVSITPSSQALAYSSRVLNLRVSSRENDTATDTFQLRITINRIRGIEIRMNETSYSIVPDGEIFINFSLINLGNHEENITAGVTDILSNYTTILDKTTYLYDAFQTKNFTIKITAPGPQNIQARAGTLFNANISGSLENDTIVRNEIAQIVMDQVFFGELTGDFDTNTLPDSVLNVPVTIRNMGNGKDTFLLWTHKLDEEWEDSLLNNTVEVDSFQISLQPGESYDFHVRLVSPDPGSQQAVAGYQSKTYIAANSSNGAVNFDSIIVTVDQIFITSIEVDQNNLRIIPGETVNYTLTIRNIGNGEDTIKLINDNPSGYWDVTMVGARTMTLLPGEQAIRILRVMAPDVETEPEFGDNASILVEAIPGDGADTDNASSILLRTFISNIMPVYHLLSIVPDSEKQVPFYVMNIDDKGRNIDLYAEIDEGWKAVFKDGKTHTKVSLFAQTMKIVNLTITTPPRDETVAGQTSSLLLYMESPDEDVVNTTMVISGVYDYSVTPDEENVTGDQGTTMSMPLTIENTGNAADTYTFQVSNLGDNWTYEIQGLDSYTQSGITKYFLILEPREDEEINLRITLPDYVASRSYPILITVTSDQGKVKQVTVNAVIKPVYKLEIELTTNSYNVKDGTDKDIRIIINNTGNIQDTVNMSIGGLPGDWGASYSLWNFILPSRTEKEIHLVLSVPPGSPSEQKILSIKASSSDVNITESFNIIINVQLQDKPDLTVTSISLSSDDPREGDSFTIQAEISNIGNENDADVVVRIYVDDDLLSEETISVLIAGKSETLRIPWDPKEGSYTIKVIVDPTSDTIEKDETNNQRTETFEIGSPSSESRFGTYLVLLLIVIMGLVLVKTRPWDKKTTSTRKKRKPVSREQKSEKETEDTWSEEVDFSEEKKKLLGEEDQESSESQDDTSEDGDENEDGQEGGSSKKVPKPRISVEEEIFPVIIKCPNCKGKMRISKAGKFRCPNVECHHIGTVDETGELIKGKGPTISFDSENDEEESDTTSRSKVSNEKVKEKDAKELVVHTKDSIFPLKYTCQDCNKKSTVGKPGFYKCPFCGSVPYINEDGELDDIPERSEQSDESSAEPTTRRTSFSGSSTSDSFIMDDGTGSGWDDQDSEDEENIRDEAETNAKSDPSMVSDDVSGSDAMDPANITQFPAVLACPSCEKNIRVPSEGTYKCPTCQETIRVGAQKQITTTCPWCDTKFKLKRTGVFNCPSCKEPFFTEEDGYSGAVYNDPLPGDWQQKHDRNLSREGLFMALHELLEDIRETDADTLYDQGIRKLGDMKDLSEVDITLLGIESAKAKILRGMLDVIQD